MSDGHKELVLLSPKGVDSPELRVRPALTSIATALFPSEMDLHERFIQIVKHGSLPLNISVPDSSLDPIKDLLTSFC